MEWRRQHGFTLIELAIVIAMGVILLTLAVPAVRGWLPDQALRQAARDLYSNLQRAKIMAIKSNANCVIVFNQALGAENYDYVIFIDTDDDLVYDAGERVINRVRWRDYRGVELDTSQGGGDGLSFADDDNGLPCIAFRNNGLTRSCDTVTVGPGRGAVFLVNSNGHKKNLEVSPFGALQIN